MNEQDARRAERDLTACTALVIDSDATARSLLVNQLKGEISKHPEKGWEVLCDFIIVLNLFPGFHLQRL